MKQGISRRAVLACVPSSFAAAAVRRRPAPSLPPVGEFVRYADPTTENIVVRLTNPSSTNLLPAPANHFISLKDRFLVFSSDRTGKMTPFRLDLRTGALKALAETGELDPRSLTLDPRERALYFIDRGALRCVGLTSRKEDRVILEGGVAAFAVGSAPGEFLVVHEGSLKWVIGDRSRLLVESVSPGCLLQPGGRGCLFCRESGGCQYWYTPIAGESKPVLLTSGPVSDAFWSRDGQSLLFLRSSDANGIRTSEIHEVDPETRQERCVAPTSQFAAFAPNGDDSVFVGASRSKAQPHIVIMLRSPHRELTLCEHRAKEATSVSPVFSPDSRRVYFESDRDGKPAIYSVNVERFVEPTSEAAALFGIKAAA